MTDGAFYDWQTGGGGGDLTRLIECWSEAKVVWCVIGGLAVNHWAKEPLITRDADIVVAFSDLSSALDAAVTKGFKVERHRYSANLFGAGNLAIQVTTDPRYDGMAERASEVSLLGMNLPVASLSDVFNGKLWAWSDPSRRPLKRRKDELDLLRLVEAWPELASQLPVSLQSQAE
jgi:hypothetical protein